MDDESKSFFMMTIEIRILAAVLARISHRSFEERFGTHKKDISGLQYGILRTLSHESCTLSELSKRFFLDPSTLVPVIDALESKGLVTRSRDPDDRRRIPLLLTEEGIALVNSVPLFHEDDLLYQSLGEMGGDKAQNLRDLLREVVKRMPDGEEMLESVTTRLYTLQGGENVTRHPPCLMHQRDEAKVEQEQIPPRTTRRRERKSHRA